MNKIHDRLFKAKAKNLSRVSARSFGSILRTTETETRRQVQVAQNNPSQSGLNWIVKYQANEFPE